MEKLNEFIQKCANEVRSRGLCKEGDGAHSAFFMIAVTKSPATKDVGISMSIGGNGVSLAAAITTVLDDNPKLASVFKAAMEAHLINKTRAEVKCNTEC
jgi:hypothetical protein